MVASSVRHYEVRAASSGIFGRVLCSARQQHFVIDGPVQNGCPGEALTPAEAFLSGVASCGVELIEVFARRDGIPLDRVEVSIAGTLDRSRSVRPDLTVLNTVLMDIRLHGVTSDQAARLVEEFKKT
jgi:uncharacterized OsmC-like protein